MSLNEMYIPEAAQELLEVDDRELTLAFKRGDAGAYEAIYARHSGRVHNVCKRMLRRPEEAQEAAQETFLRMYRALPKFNGKYQLGAWITRIATNVCLDQLRSQGRHPVDLTPFDELELVSRDASDGVEPESVYMRSNEGWRVRRVLDSLPPMHKAAIVLRDFEGLSYEEVAGALGISDAQTKALIHRARQSFKRQWGAEIASILFPAKLFEKIRSADMFRPEHAQAAGHVVNSSGSFAAQCSAALQQCGVFVAERAGALVTAAVVGTAAMGTGIPAPEVVSGGGVEASVTDTSASASPDRKLRLASGSGEASKRKLAGGVERTDQEKEGEAPAPVEVPQAEPAPPETPQPEPEDPAEPAESDPPSPEPKPTSSPAPEGPPEPTGFAAPMTTDVDPEAGLCAGCARPTQVKAEVTQAGEAGLRSFSQSLTGVVSSAEFAAFGAEIEHSSSDMSAHRMVFKLWTKEGSYAYSASGSWASSGTTEWGGLSYTFTGTYALGSRPTRGEIVPQQGTYTLVLEYSSKQTRITSSSISFQESQT